MMTAVGELRLRHALRADLPTIVDVWVDAFAGDAYLRWIAPADDEWARFGHDWLTFVVELTFERGHTYLADPADVAVAWIPPDLSLVGPGDFERGRSIIDAHAGTERADQAAAAIAAARAHAIEEPHWTLQYIGVRSSRHSRGLGRQAVEPILAVCDDEHLPCTLVSSNGRNVPFYERIGFGVVAECATADGAAVLRPMLRRPRQV